MRFSGALLIRRQSFTNLQRWLTDARALAPQVVIVLIGNKLDREEDREVEYAEGSRWAKENGESYDVKLMQVASLSKFPPCLGRTL